MELRLLGLGATVDPERLVVPRNVASGVRIVVRAGGSDLALADALRFLGAGLEVRGELSGPGLPAAITVPQRGPGDPLPADPFLIALPALPTRGEYTLSGLRIESGGRAVLDVTPSAITVEVIEQILVTSVQTRSLTLDEIREKGIVLDSDDYLGFEFSLGLQLEAQPVRLDFPVVFDRQGVPVPAPLAPPLSPARQGIPLPTIVPLLLEPPPEGGGGPGGGARRPPLTLPNGQPIRIPAVLIIPGNVGYLKQFFSALLFVANGAPLGSGLAVRDVQGTIRLPPGDDHAPGTDDDPLSLPDTTQGPQPTTLAVLGVGPDGAPGTGDDVASFAPGEQGQAEFLLEGEREGFHSIAFDIAAVLEGLPTGPVAVSGRASGGVLVRNAFLDVTFTVPSVVRRGERFTLYASVVNIGQGIANDVSVTLDAAAVAGAHPLSDTTVRIDTIAPGDSRTVSFALESQATGQVVASYLALEGPGQSGGTLRFTLGVGERGVPLSPDTLVLPAPVDAVPSAVLEAAMRVLGQAWSLANAPAGTLPPGVTRTSKTVVVQKALALAEAGLRITLGQDVADSIRALAYDIFAGDPRDPGFDQLLSETEAGSALRASLSGVPAEEPVADGGPQLVAAHVIGPETLAGAGPFGLHALLLFDRILDAGTAAESHRYTIPDNAVRTSKAVMSGRLVVLALEQPEGPHVPTTIDVVGVVDRRGRRGGGSTPLGSRLLDPGAVVSGHVLAADGTPVRTATVVLTSNVQEECRYAAPSGLAARPVEADGRFEFRYVRRDHCGLPFEVVTQDPASGAQRKANGFVRVDGERIGLDLVLIGRGAVEGVVRDLLSAQPVPGASVTVLSALDPQSGGSGTTDASGYYRIEGITVGPVSVRAGKGASLGRGAGRIERAGTTATVDVVLAAGSVRVSGHVRKVEDGAASSVPGVGVVFRIFDSLSPPQSTPVGYVVTDAEGSFAFEGMPSGTFRLEAGLATGERAESALETTAPGDDLTHRDLLFIIDTTGTATLEGDVYLPNPPADPQAAAAAVRNAIVSVGSRGVVADDRGHFVLPGIPVQPGIPQTVSAISADRRRHGSSGFLANAPGETVPVLIPLSGLGHAHFTVLDPDDRPVAGLPVLALSPSCADPCGCGSAKTDVDGQVTFSDLPLGTFTVQAWRDTGRGIDAVRGSVSVVRDNETASALLRFSGLGSVWGVVADQSKRAVHGAEVRLRASEFVYDGQVCQIMPSDARWATTGVDGSFRFTGLALGPVTVTASQVFLPRPVSATGVLTRNGQDLELPVELRDTSAGVLEGDVRVPDGTTLAGRGVRVVADGPLPNVTVETNDAGHYRFADNILPEGYYTLTASDPATGGVARTAVQLVADQNLRADLRLKGRGTVHVTVVDGADRPIQTAYAKLKETDFPHRSYEAPVEPATGGVAVFEGVYEGPFSVEAQDVYARGGRASGVLPRAGETVGVTVRLSSTGRVSGRFLMPDGATPIPFGTVKIVAGGRTIGQTTTAGFGDIGYFEFDFVPAGPVRLEAQDPVTGRRGVAVGTIETEGQTLPLDVLAEALGTVTGEVRSNGAIQPEAEVEIASGDFRVKTLTNGSGVYTVAGVPAGRVTVSASLANGALQSTASDNLVQEGQVLTVNVALRASGGISGRVLAADRGEAPVSVVTFRSAGGGLPLTAVTGSGGSFAFERVPAGPAHLDVDAASSIDRASVSVTVPEADLLEVPVYLNGVGGIKGVAVDSSGHETAGTVWIQAALGQWFYFTVGTSGSFDLPEVLAGTFTARLTATTGGLTLYGTATGTVEHGQVALLEIRIQPSGTVTGAVVRGDGTTPAFGAEVTLRLAQGGEAGTQAQADGSFALRGVPLGSFDILVRDPLTAGLAVKRGLAVVENGQTVEVGTLRLDATPPRVEILDPVDGSTRAAFGGSILLRLSDAESGADPQSLVVIYPGGFVETAGYFTFTGDTATGPIISSTLGENPRVVQIKDQAGNVASVPWRYTILGGAVRGTVLTAAGAAAAGAQVDLGSGTPMTTDAEGRFVFTGVRPGNYSLRATDPATGLVTQLWVTDLGDGEDRTLAEPVRLPASGRIFGTVFAAGGPSAGTVGGVTVAAGGRSTTTNESGEYELAGLGIGTHALTASVNGRPRARETVAVDADGAQVLQNLTLVGVATVHGTVTDAAGTVEGATVSLQSLTPWFGGSFSATSDASGVFAIPDVPVGRFTVSATRGADRADASGEVPADGVDVTRDLQLLAAAITLPASLTDGNDLDWSIAKDGTLTHGWMLQDLEKAPFLTLTRAGTTAPFTGPECPPDVTCAAATEEGQREIVVRQADLLGLEVTRKVYVPRDGYFVRHLELVRNPGPDPVTFDLGLTLRLDASTVLATASGDDVLGPDDVWAVLDDADAGDIYESGSPHWAFAPLALVSGGPGGLAPGSFEAGDAADGDRLVTATWPAVTLAPGGTFGLMHLLSAQADRARAQAAAERLAQMPPEVLLGLGPIEAAAVRNVVLPGDLSSPVPPLPPLDGIVEGHVWAGDGATPVAGESVAFRSQVTVFGRTLKAWSQADGSYVLSGDPGHGTVVPRAGFDLVSKADVLGTRTAVASGAFAVDGDGVPAAKATADLVYRGTGVLHLTASRADTSVIPNVALFLSRDGQTIGRSTGPSGSVKLTLLPPGDLSVRAAMPNGPEQTVAPVTVVADTLTPLPIVFAGLHRVTGQLFTAESARIGGWVSLASPGLTRTDSVSATQDYLLTDVPAGTHLLKAVDSTRSHAFVEVPLTVTGDTTADLTLPPVAPVTVTVRLGSSTGPPLASAPVYWSAPTLGPDPAFGGYTNASGALTIPHVAGPAFRVRAHYPGVPASSDESPQQSLSEGEPVGVSLVVPGVGSVAGVVRSRDGLAQPSAPVSVLLPDDTSLASARADGSGAFGFTSLPVRPLRLRSACGSSLDGYSFSATADVDVGLVAHGETLTRDGLCPLGSLTAERRRDFWTLTARPGDAVGVMLVGAATWPSLSDPFLEVYGPEGTLVASNDNRGASDRNAEVDFVAPAEGAYVVVARAAAAETGGYRLGDWTGRAPVLRAYEPPRVSGTVRRASDGAAISGVTVRLARDGTPVESIVTANGSYTLAAFPLGSFALETADTEGVVVARATIEATTPGATIFQDLEVTGRGVVTVTVKRGSSGVPGATVTVTSDHPTALAEDRERTRITGADGTATTVLPAGTIVARGIDPLSGVTYETTGVLADGGTLLLDLSLPTTIARVFGTVTAAGAPRPPLPGATVTLTGTATLATTTGLDGTYEFAAVPPGSYTITTAIGGASASQALSLSGGEVPVDVQVPVSVVMGRVTESDGRAATAIVELCGSGYTCASRTTDATGQYAFYGDLPAWAPNTYVSVRARAVDAPGLDTTSWFYFAPGTVKVCNLAFPRTFAVFGFVTDPSPRGVEAEVTLSISGATRAATTGADGSFRFERVPSGRSVTASARRVDNGLTVQRSGYVSDRDLQLDVTVPYGAFIRGMLQAEDGGPSQATLEFESREPVNGAGALAWRTWVTPDETGWFQATVPEGGFLLTSWPGGCAGDLPARELVAAAEGTLVPGPNPDVSLRLGDAARYPLVLSGPLGNYGPTPYYNFDPCAVEPGRMSLRLQSVDNSYQQDLPGLLDGGRRSVRSLGWKAGDLLVREEQFVPASGAFQRTIAWLTNPTSASVTSSVFLQGSVFTPRSVVLADASGDGWLDPADEWFEARGENGLGFGAVLGAGVRTETALYDGDPYEGSGEAYLNVTYTVDVPAGATVGIMVFTVARDVDLGASGAIRALADLSEPEALQGLDDVARAAIVNFTLPAEPAPATGVTGVVRAGAAAVPDAWVGAIDGGGRAVASSVANGAGEFTLRGLTTGNFRLVAVDPLTNRPGAATASVTDGALTPADVTLLPPSELGTVMGQVTDLGGFAASGVPVIASVDAYAPVWRSLPATTNEEGHYEIPAVPAGEVRARVEGEPASERAGTLAPGGALTLPLQVPW